MLFMSAALMMLVVSMPFAWRFCHTSLCNALTLCNMQTWERLKERYPEYLTKGQIMQPKLNFV